MAYSFYRTITIDSSKCGSASSTDFPLLFSGTYTYLKTVANGGDVTDANGYDIIFCSSTDPTSILNFELVNYSSTTGVVEFWIKIPTLSNSVDTVIYLFYKNPSVTTYQGNTTGTWNSNFKRVYHVSDGTTLSGTDSTGNANATLSNTPTAITGKIDGGANFVRGSNQALSASASGLPTTGNSFSLGCWLKTSSVGSEFILTYGAGGVAAYLGYGSPSAGRPYFGDAVTLVAGGSTINDGNWHRAFCTYNGSNSRKLYIDGSLANSDANSITVTAATNLAIGNDINFGTFASTSQVDEIYFLSSVLAADWIVADFNNQNNPSTFYTLGAAVPVGGGGSDSQVIIERRGLNYSRFLKGL